MGTLKILGVNKIETHLAKVNREDFDQKPSYDITVKVNLG